MVLSLGEANLYLQHFTNLVFTVLIIDGEMMESFVSAPADEGKTLEPQGVSVPEPSTVFHFVFFLCQFSSPGAKEITTCISIYVRRSRRISLSGLATPSLVVC